jgi:hypothetical protein
MPTCPHGHVSVDTDYCDECGARLGGVASGPAPGSPAGAPAGAGEPCPDCGTPRTGRFCETCGHDFLAAAPSSGPPLSGTPPVGSPAAPPVGPSSVGSLPSGSPSVGSSSVGSSSVGSPSSGSPSSGSPPSSPPPVGSRAAPPVDPRAAVPGGSPAAVPAGGPGGSPAPELSRAAGPAAGWRLVVGADRAYHERMLRAAAPGAQPVPFPAYCPQRRFELPGRQVLIGRRSRSRGIEPDIDLTGPPEDAAVSHAHALLVAVPEGWAVVDLDSANGTYLNDSADPIEANVPVPVGDGDRIHLGAWTTMTLQFAG